MAISDNPFLRAISGSINKEIVVKQYAHGTVITKYPDMSKVILSANQERSNSLFDDAVKYTRSILADPVKLNQYKQTLMPDERVYNHAIRTYMIIQINTEDEIRRRLTNTEDERIRKLTNT